ncbi:DUF1360 domain-containing protein [Pontibacillus salicampi]|uniref:DUF1360 domain-containing protein n=1 Tax=Pontibacillus salicampi TaxID=1449801 RepID=A0ABV6LR81_9BACI
MVFTWMELVILILASYRVTNLLVYDTIMDWMRRPFHNTIRKENAQGEIEEYIEVKGAGLQAFIGELLSCHWCTGFWVSVVILLTFLYAPPIQPLVVIFAVAGGASLLAHIFPRE